MDKYINSIVDTAKTELQKMPDKITEAIKSHKRIVALLVVVASIYYLLFSEE